MNVYNLHFAGPFDPGFHELDIGATPPQVAILVGTIVNASGATLSVPHSASTATNAIGLSVLGDKVRINIGPGWAGQQLTDLRVTIGT